ncbi:MAG: PD-(D/E)XK nuclease family protein [Patescibacteria group bacterium]|nr:PD-(D/E)XK nuclease family protein [Patescibacteria group bacterium]
MAFLRNPLAWHKRYVEEVYDTPYGPASAVGRACHKALEHYYSGLPKEAAAALGLEYLRDIADFEINFGRASSKLAKKKKRASMEREYLQGIGFYLARAPKYKVLAVESKSTVEVSGLPLPIKAVSDLVVVSKVDPRGVDVIDHKFVSSFTTRGGDKPLYIIQAIFNYYAVKKTFGKPVRRFIINECKISRNIDGSPQVRRHVVDFRTFRKEFIIFNRLVRDATEALRHMKVFLPNPSDIFEGEDSFMLYHFNLAPEEYDTHFRPDE